MPIVSSSCSEFVDRGERKIALAQLAAEFEQLALNDAKLPLEGRSGCSAILALRSCEFSEFTRLRRTPRRRDG